MRATVLQKIEDVKMLGDNWHNKTIDLLFDGVNRRSKYAKQVMFRLDIIYQDSTHRWCPIPNSYARKLNGLMKSKTDTTFQKRLVKYISFLVNGTHYGKLFHKTEIQEFHKLVNNS